VPVLESAIKALRQVESIVGAGREPAKSPIRIEIDLLRRDLGRIVALARQAALHYQVRAQLLSPDDGSVSNYTPAGTPASPLADRVVVLHG